MAELLLLLPGALKRWASTSAEWAARSLAQEAAATGEGSIEHQFHVVWGGGPEGGCPVVFRDLYVLE